MCQLKVFLFVKWHVKSSIKGSHLSAYFRKCLKHWNKFNVYIKFIIKLYVNRDKKNYTIEKYKDFRFILIIIIYMLLDLKK